MGREQREGESLTAYDERRADENEEAAERLDSVEAALTQVQHIAHDGLVEIEQGTTWFLRWHKARELLEKINSIAEGGAADPEFVAMLAAARDEDGFVDCGRCGKPGCDPSLERHPGEGVICDECRDTAEVDG